MVERETIEQVILLPTHLVPRCAVLGADQVVSV